MATNSSEESTRGRMPNVTLDNAGIRHEKLLQLRKSRSAAKANITKKIKEVTECFSNCENVADVRLKAQEFHDTANNFRDAHNTYHASLDDEFEIQDSQEYFECETQRIVNFQRTLDEWFAKAEDKHRRKVESEVDPRDSVSNAGSRSRARSKKSLRSGSRVSETGSSAFSPRTAAAAKRASLAAEAASLRRKQTLQEEELQLKHEGLKYQQHQEAAELRLQQRKQQLQLETEIAKTEAEEEVYALAELGDPYAQRPLNSKTRFQDLATSPPLGQPPDFLNRETHFSLPTPKGFDPPSKGQQSSHGPPDDSRETTGSRKDHQPIPVNSQPGRQFKIFSPEANPWTPANLPKPELSDHRSNSNEIKRERSPSSSNSAVGEKFIQDMIDIQRQQQQHNEQLMYMQQYRDHQLQQLLGQHQQLSLTLTLPHAEVHAFDGDPVNYCNFIRSFENLIEAKTKNSSTKLYYLVQYTTGDVQELMKSCLSMQPDEGYQEARRLLKSRYGQSYKIATAYVNRVTNGPPIKHEDGEALQKFSVLLTSCKNTLKEIKCLNKIENPDSLQRVVERLPFQLRQRWRDVADDITSNKQREITFEDIARFVETKARALNHPIFGNVSSELKSQGKDPKRRKPRYGDSFATQGEVPVSGGNGSSPSGADPTKATPKCHLCNGSHWLTRCREFKKQSVDQRLAFVRKKGLCENCFQTGHMVPTCPKNSYCKIPNCRTKHSTFLHPKAQDHNNGNLPPNQNRVNEVDGSAAGNYNGNAQNGYVNGDSRCALTGAGVSTVGLPIVPVKVKARGSDTPVLTYAFLDSGSNTSFCSHQLMEMLAVDGEKTTLSLTTLGKQNSATECSVFNLEVFDLDEHSFVELPAVFSTPKLPVSKDSIPRQEDLSKYPHLKGIELPKIDACIGLLIGNDVPKALEPKEIRECNGQGPYAVRTVFGWTINGPLERKGNSARTANFIRADNELSQQFAKFCNLEFSDSVYDKDPGMSKEDLHAMNIMEQSVKLKEGHYEIALPWRNVPPNLPDNRPLAEHRLKLLRRRLLKNQELLLKYSSFMEDLVKNGHARKVPQDRLTHPVGAVWYLPHHPVLNPNKPDKVRVVFDCAAKHQGTSLNDQLLQGPDLTNNLVGVLTRFRQEPVALMADVESMFHQVHVSPDDCDALRFLWWPNNDLNSDPEEYQMMVHLFGATSSPSCANFGLRRTAEDNQQAFSKEAVNSVKDNFYVDDCLKSVSSENKAIVLVDELRQLLSKGGFRLTKWISNSRKVIDSIPTSERAGSVKDLLLDQLPIERALGVRWDVESDTFGFKISVKDKPPTRRGILSVVSSVYDPLGFAAPFTLPAKALLQDLCRKNLGWDDPISDEDLTRWRNWLDELPRLEDLKVDRCFKPIDFGEVASIQLHHFADASQHAYGAVTYFRVTNTNGEVHCSFLIGKSRLSPLKQLTIPRLELSAAVVATRLDKMLRKEIGIPIDQSIFWTDSTCVLGYVTNEDKRFHTFVANRIAAIQEVSSPHQWRHVGTKENPADDASRGLSADALLNNKRWLKGPDFLWKSEEDWPNQQFKTSTVAENDPEVKKESQVFSTKTETEKNTLNQLFRHFSQWYRLKKFVAWLLRYRANLRKAALQRKSGSMPDNQVISIEPMTVEELDMAESVILAHVQKESFKEEIAILKNSRADVTTRKPQVKKSSKISKLDPRLMDGLLRVGGRLENAPLHRDAKHPIILPTSHHVVGLIISFYHQASGHSGTEHVLSMIRERFWIIKARAAVRKSLNSCFNCRKRQAPVGEQKMANLPRDRITPDKPPFTYVGVDCFGPFLVRRGRSQVKRYGVVFTCLTVRAIHIEVVHSLDTDSFLQSMSRFICRRGKPEVVRSDNGGNFVHGEKELRSAIEGWNQDVISECLLQRNVQWIFNPPAGSHHGGVWERCIRTIRKVMNALLKEQVLNDEGLTTLMCEVESIVNGRPLTKVSDDPRDPEALTPNHLLLLRSGPEMPPGVFAKGDLYSRRRWRQVQHLADVFWRRWLKEYLPCLQERQKWPRSTSNFEVGDVVLVVDENSPRNSWPLGRITEVKPNKRDGLVRRVSLKTKTAVLERPIDKIVLLEAPRLHESS